MGAPRVEILVVDDSDDFLAAVRSWIETQPQLRVIAAARTGEEALGILAHSTPHLVLIDAVMPGLDGFETTRRIKTVPGAPLVVMLSVHEGPAVEREAWAAGADAFVPKAEFAVRLPGVIRALMSGQRLGPDGGRGPAAGRDAGGRPERPRGRSHTAAPDGTSERTAFLAPSLQEIWRAARARIRNVGTDRRPEVVSAGCLTEGGIS